MSWNANFIYAQGGNQTVKEILKDPKKSIGLFIAIDPFINESSIFADYIVPDSVMYENWGITTVWAASQTKANHLRFPIMESRNAKFKNGEPITMDSFIIELGLALGLPGFGKGALRGKNGENFDLYKAEDFYIRAFENLALDAQPVPDIDDNEFKLSGLKEMYEETLKRISKENYKKVAYVMARGGRFASKKESYKGEFINNIYEKPVAIYNENLASLKNSLTEEKFSGSPKYYAPRYADGTKIDFDNKLLAFSYKSVVFSSPVAASSGVKRIYYTNFVDINPITAKSLNLKNGDVVEISSVDGVITGILRYKERIVPGSIGVEHGCGRDGEGASDLEINGAVKTGLIWRRSGTALNKIGLKDKSKGANQILSDFIARSNSRQAVPVQVRKIS